MKNKKSQVEDWLPMLLLIALLIVVFFITLIPNIQKEKEKKKITEFQSLDIDSDQYLVDFLRTELEENLNVADTIIVYLKDEEELMERVGKKAEKFFLRTGLETDTSSWSLEIKYRNKIITIDSEKVKSTADKRVYYDIRRKVSSTIIPHLDLSTIEIKLFFVSTNY